MSFRTVLVIALALVFGGSAAVGVNSLRSSSPEPTETVPVVVAARDIPRGHVVTADLLKTKEWPKANVPEEARTEPDALLGRVTYTPLVKGELVLDAKLCPKGVRGGAGALTRPGMRSFPIPTPDVASGMGGLIQPNDRVDVLLTITEDGGSTTPLLRNVEVLAVDQRFDPPPDGKVDPKDLRSVTLQVTPRQANLLALGQKKGTLQLVLRNPQDREDGSTPPAIETDLGLKRAKPWDVRAKALLEAFAKEWADQARKELEKPKAEPKSPPPEPDPPVIIRTLRGSHEGRVEVYSPGR